MLICTLFTCCTLKIKNIHLRLRVKKRKDLSAELKTERQVKEKIKNKDLRPNLEAKLEANMEMFNRFKEMKKRQKPNK